MQKVEGSSPFIRFRNPVKRGFRLKSRQRASPMSPIDSNANGMLGEGGAIELTEAPGLGCEQDEDFVDAHRVRR